MRSHVTYAEFERDVSSVILTENGNCPVVSTVRILQGKWKLQVLYALCIKSPSRFGELKRMLKTVTNTMLSTTLNELEEDGLINRVQYNEMPLRVEYSLTGKGRDLMPVFYELARWGLKYIP